jgi:PIN domain nuclease of toxin-antitoxin system
MIVLDTHAWLWWCSDRVKLPASLVRRLAKKSELYVSAISVWEVCMYAYRQRPSHAQLNAQPRAAVRALCAADGIRMRLPSLAMHFMAILPIDSLWQLPSI